MVENGKLEMACSENETDDDGAPDLNELLVPMKVKTRLRCQVTGETLRGAKAPSKKRIVLHCGLCRATFGRPDHLKRHIECVHSTFTFCKCPVCDKQFATEAAVKRHVKATHSASDTYKCRVCQTAFSSFSKLIEHEVAHVTTHHTCEECGKKFKRRDHMLRHVKSQHLNQHLACVHCSLAVKRRDQMTRHLREKHSIAEPEESDSVQYTLPGDIE